MAQKIFLTGRPGSGKSTLFQHAVEVLREKGVVVGGIATPEERVEGTRTGFGVVDLASGKQGTLASVTGSGPRVGKYRVDVEGFESVALPALDHALKECNVVGVDELGKMEFCSKKFGEKIDEIMESGKPVLAVVGKGFADKFKKFGEVIEVTAENRSALAERIARGLIPT